MEPSGVTTLKAEYSMPPRLNLEVYRDNNGTVLICQDGENGDNNMIELVPSQVHVLVTWLEAILEAIGFQGEEA